MSKKLILLPLDLYKGLLNTKTDKDEDLAEHGPLHYEKAQLGKIKRKKLKNLSTKNVLYNQQLRRYLRTRKEAKDRPIKLKLAEGDVKLLKAAKNAQEPTKLAAVDENGDLQSVKVEEELPRTRFSVGSDEVFASPIGPGPSFEVPKKNSPLKLRRHTTTATTKKDQGVMKSVALMQEIMANPRKFGVSEEGEIINPNTGNPLKNSNLKHAVSRLVNPSMQNAPSPPGFSLLKKAVLNDPKASRFISEGHQIGKGKKIKEIFRPSKWKK